MAKEEGAGVAGSGGGGGSEGGGAPASPGESLRGGGSGRREEGAGGAANRGPARSVVLGPSDTRLRKNDMKFRKGGEERMFLGLPDPELDPLIRGNAPDLDPSLFS